MDQFLVYLADFSDGAAVKNVLANAGDASGLGSVPGLGRSPGVENGNPLQYSCLAISMNRGTWQARSHGVAESQLEALSN